MTAAGVNGRQPGGAPPGRPTGRSRPGETDRAAVAAVVAAHQRMVYGFLRARVVDATAVDDLCQEVFLRFLTSRPPAAQGSGEVSAWLVGIARNVLREHVRRCTRRREVAWTELCLDIDAAAEIGGDDADDRLRRLPACLDGLGRTARTALDMHYGENRRLGEIGRHFDRSEGAVKLLLFRARQAVRRCLDAGGPVPGEVADD